MIETPMVEQPMNSSVVPSTGTIHSETILDSTQYKSAKPAIEPGSAMLTVSVPLNAKVTVNDHPTTSDGTVRQFVSQGLKEGMVYSYDVKVMYDDNGEEKTNSKSVKLRAGETKELDFEAPSAAAKAVEDDATDQAAETAATSQPSVDDEVTVVRLFVPADAKVTLAGNATKGNGAVRTFRTKQLKAGQEWKDYTIRVEAIVNGQAATQERTLNVTAGSTNELTFDFDTNGSIVRN